MAYFAEVKDNVVQRVIVAEDMDWCIKHLGGEWVETFHNHPTKTYAGKNFKYNPKKDDFDLPDLTQEEKERCVFGNIFIRKNKLSKKGMSTLGHKHNFDHLTQFVTGSFHLVETTPEGEIIEEDYKAPSERLIKKDSLHEITALEDNSMYQCVFSHRDENGKVIQEPTGSRVPYV